MYACGLITYNSKELVLVVEPNVIFMWPMKYCVLFNASQSMVRVLKKYIHTYIYMDFFYTSFYK